MTRISEFVHVDILVLLLIHTYDIWVLSMCRVSSAGWVENYFIKSNTTWLGGTQRVIVGGITCLFFLLLGWNCSDEWDKAYVPLSHLHHKPFQFEGSVCGFIGAYFQVSEPFLGSELLYPYIANDSGQWLELSISR